MFRPALPAVAGLLVTTALAPAAVPVYGGPAYDPTTGVGYRSSGSFLFFRGEQRAGEGVGYGSAVSSGGNDRPIAYGPSGVTLYAVPPIGGAGQIDAAVTGRNAAGVSVGYQQRISTSSSTGDRTFVSGQAIRWNAAGQPTVLGDALTVTSRLGSYATGVNAVGTAVGTTTIYRNDAGYTDQSLDTRPVRWDAGTSTPTPLDVLGLNADGHTYAYVLGITTAGQAYGFVQKNTGSDFGTRAVRWDAVGTAVHELDNGAGASGVYIDESVRGFTDNGYVVGHTRTRSPTTGSYVSQLPTRWNPDGTVTALSLTTATASFGTNNPATDVQAVNATGTAVGHVGTTNNYTDALRAARWDAGGALTILGVLGTPTGTTSTLAEDINAAGVAVGTQRTRTAASDGIAVLWGADGVAVNLNTFIDPANGWTLTDASSITDTGWVSGVGLYDPDGAGPTAAYSRAFLIQVPEPAALGGLVAAGLLLARRSRRR